jgi:hypothetical protein
MDEALIFGSFVSLWDTDENERVRIGIGTCRDLSMFFIYGFSGLGKCTTILIEAVNEDYEQWKLFYLVVSVK